MALSGLSAIPEVGWLVRSAGSLIGLIRVKMAIYEGGSRCVNLLPFVTLKITTKQPNLRSFLSVFRAPVTADQPARMVQRRDAWVQVVVVSLRVNVNLKAITFEELEGRRKVPPSPPSGSSATCAWRAAVSPSAWCKLVAHVTTTCLTPWRDAVAAAPARGHAEGPQVLCDPALHSPTPCPT